MPESGVRASPSLEAHGRAEHIRLCAIIPAMHKRVLSVTPIEGGTLKRADGLTSTMPMSHQTRFQLQVAANHLLTYTDAMKDTDTPTRYAGHSLVRGALEGAVTALWLQQPGTLARRALRSLRWTWWEQNDAADFAAEVGTDASDEKASMLALLEADKNRIKGLNQDSVDHPRPTRTAMIIDVQRRLPAMPQPTILAAWRQTSSLAHGNSAVARMSFNLASIEGASEHLRYATTSWAVSSALLRTAVAAFDASVSKFEERAAETPSHRRPPSPA
ncbi:MULTISPECIES: hypothetical protein [unclassified Microbacterium]|uniref:hypothetical protein n=1 Tax=unclassified Microbacterium TaxID=2609290 RepID=UPI000EAAAF46|nr:MULTISPECIES: hypothetical protein [unclassified Microbacterium]MBT2484964.1 hypothetical protein [Microbacterium sp. ISL-108]RKN67821.1 hypothetical protein D7252_09630 [Microbacterium sp. CGR2]